MANAQDTHTTSATLLLKGQGYAEGWHAIAAPETSPLRWLTVARLGVEAERPYAGETGATEVVLDILSGNVLVSIEGQTEPLSAGRADPWSAGPTFLCLPPGVRYRVSAVGPSADLLAFSAATDPGLPPTAVSPEQAPARSVGGRNWVREVWPGTAIGEATRRLLVGETRNPAGGWSSYPPHKHDTNDPPREAIYEEVYFFQVRPKGGFGMQRIYERRAATAEGPEVLDAALVVEDGDTVIIPRGYHPVVAAPGYELVYVWALAGVGHTYGAWTDDPAHVWVRELEGE